MENEQEIKFYVTAVNKQMKAEQDNPTIGLQAVSQFTEVFIIQLIQTCTKEKT